MMNWTTDVYLAVAKWISLATFVGVAIWAVFRPKAFIFEDAPTTRRWRDLRIWSVLFMIVQIAIYLSL
ncbi:hypothetical protein JW992_04005 [candidate division KSB1 bacterium]|nr:hypothetical protein [candidate division KSB1 bacterium]